MNDLKDFLRDFNKEVDEAAIMAYVARDSGLQHEACGALATLIKTVASKKAEMVAAANEDAANCLLGCECAAYAILAEIRMWLYLKADQPEKAWDELIYAQTASAAAVRAHRGFAHLVEKARSLEEIERVVFPPQVFVSAGLIVDLQECSICQAEYGTCKHLAGMPYMGEFCQIITKGITGNHVAMVKNPADKKCTVTEFQVEGGYRNRMTWVVTPAAPGELDDDGEGGLRAKMRFLSTGS